MPTKYTLYGLSQKVDTEITTISGYLLNSIASTSGVIYEQFTTISGDIVTQIPSLSGYATESWVSNNYIDNAEITTISGDIVAQIGGGDVTLEKLTTTSGDIVEQIPELTGYATEYWVDEWFASQEEQTSPSGLAVTYGTLEQGTYEDLSSVSGTLVIISEDIGLNASLVTITFSGVTLDPNQLIIYGNYDGGASHQTAIELYNINTTNWDQIGLLTHFDSLTWYSFPIFLGNNYVDSGTVELQFRHIQSGIAGHSLNLDYISLRHSITSGAGVNAQTAASVSVETTTFSGNLSANDTSVQQAFETLDGLIVGGDVTLEQLTTTSGDIVSQIPSLTGYATESWVSTNYIDTTEITNYATDAALITTSGDIIAQLADYATDTELTTASGDIVDQIPSLVGYATESWVNINFIDDEELTTISGDIVAQIPSLVGYATESWVETNYIDNAELTTISGDIVEQIPSLSGYATESWVDTNYIDNSELVTTSGDIISQIPSDYINSVEMTTISGDIIDQIPSLSGYATESWVATNYIDTTEIEDYATDAELTTTSGDIINQIPVDYIDSAEMTSISGDIISQIPSLSGYATESWVSTGYIDNSELITTSGDIIDQIPSLAGYATEAWVSTNYIDDSELTTTSGDIIAQIPVDYIDTSELITTSGDIVAQIPSLSGYATESWVNTNFIDTTEITEYATKDYVDQEIATISGGGVVTLNLLTTVSGDIVSQIPTPDDYIDPNELITTSGDIVSQIPSLSGYATETWTSDNYIDNDELTTTSGDIVTQIPSLSGYATESWVSDNYIDDTELTTTSGDIVSQIPSLSGYATEAWVGTNFIDTTEINSYATNSELTTVSGDIVAQLENYSTDAELTTTSGDIVAQIPSLSGYATQSWVSTNYIDNSELTTISGDIIDQIPSLSGYATESWVGTNFIDDAELTTTSGDIVDQIPTDYIDSAEMTTISGDIVTQIPSLSGYATESWVSTNYIDTTEIADYATNTTLITTSGDIVDQIPSLTGYATESWVSTGYIDNSEITTISGDIVDQIPSLSGYATESWVSTNYIDNDELTTASGDIVTQIPSLSGYATESWVNTNFIDTTEIDAYATDIELTTASGDIVAQIPSLTGYATESWVGTNYIDNSEMVTVSGDIVDQIPSLTGYATEAWVSTNYIDTTEILAYATDIDLITTSGDIVAQIPSLSGYATEAWVGTNFIDNSELVTASGDIVSQIPSLTGYATESWVGTNFIDTTEINSYATITYVDQQIASISGGGGVTLEFLTAVSGEIVEQIPSLDGYATQAWVSDGYIDNNELTTASGDIISQIPSLTGYATEAWTSDNYIDNDELTTISGDIVLQIPSLSGYATQSWVNTNFIDTTEINSYATTSELTTVSGDIVAQLGDYVTDNELTTASGDIVSQIPSLVGYATQSWVNTNFIDTTEITDYVTNAELITTSGDIVGQIPSLSGYATESWVSTNYIDNSEIATYATIANLVTTSGDIVSQLTDYVTDAELTTISGDIVDQIPSLTGYATQSWVSTNYIDDAELATVSGDIVAQIPSLSGYATESWVGTNYIDTFELTTASGDIIDQIPSLTGYATESWVSTNYIDTTEIAAYATDVDLVTTSGDIVAQLTDYVTDIELTTVSGDIIDQIPSLSGYATESWVDSGYISNSEITTISGDIVDQIPSLTGYATESWVSTNYIDNTEIASYATNATLATVSGDIVSQIPSLSGYATESWVNTNFIDTTEITSYATQTWVQDNYIDNSEITTISGDIISQIPSLTGYATEAWVGTNFIDDSELTTVSGDIVNQIPSLSGYATESWVNTNFIDTTEILAYATDAELTTASGDIVAQIPSLAGYATESWVSDGYIDNSEMTTISGDLVAQMGAGEVTQEQLTTTSGDIVSQIPSLIGYATESWVTNQNYIDITELTTTSGDIIDQIPVDYVNTTELVTTSGDIIDYINTTYSGESYGEITSFFSRFEPDDHVNISSYVVTEESAFSYDVGYEITNGTITPGTWLINYVIAVRLDHPSNTGWTRVLTYVEDGTAVVSGTENMVTVYENYVGRMDTKESVCSTIVTVTENTNLTLRAAQGSLQATGARVFIRGNVDNPTNKNVTCLYGIRLDQIATASGYGGGTGDVTLDQLTTTSGDIVAQIPSLSGYATESWVSTNYIDNSEMTTISGDLYDLIQTVSGGSATLSGIGGIETYYESGIWYIDGTVSGVTCKRGTGSFAESGYNIEHNLGTLEHTTNITLAGTGAFDEYATSSVGQIYVQIGTDTDVVYNTGGSESYGIGFYWEALEGGDIVAQVNGGVTYDDLVTTSGDIVSQIPSLAGYATQTWVSDSYIDTTEMTTISGDLVAQMGAGEVTQEQLTTTSGDIIDQIPSLTGYATEAWVSTNYADNSEVTTISGDIVSQIPSLAGYATESWVGTNYIDNTEMTTISGDLVAQMGAGEVTQEQLTTTSGDIVSQIPSLAGYATESYVSTNYIDNSEMTTISGDLVDQIGSSSSPTTEGTAGESLSQYEILYLNSSDAKWYKSVCNDTQEKAEVYGICTEAGGLSADSTGEITLQGKVTNAGWSLTPGNILYGSTTSGAISQNRPDTEGYYARSIGIAIDTDEIWFAPEAGYQVVSGTTAGAIHDIMGGRLVAASDTSLKWEFCESNQVTLWNDTTRTLVSLASEPTLANTADDLDSSALASGYNYDIFLEYSSSTVATLVAKKWTDDTTRAVVPEFYNGTIVYDADTAAGRKRRFVGTIRMASSPKSHIALQKVYGSGITASNHYNYSYRLVIDGDLFPFDIAAIRVGFSSGASYSFNVDNVSVGIRDTGANTTTTPTEILFSSGSGFAIGTDSSILSDWLTFSSSAGDDLIVVFDIDNINGYINQDTAAGYGGYYKSATNSYDQSSVTGFTDGGSNFIASLFWVEIRNATGVTVAFRADHAAQFISNLHHTSRKPLNFFNFYHGSTSDTPAANTWERFLGGTDNWQLEYVDHGLQEEGLLEGSHSLFAKFTASVTATSQSAGVALGYSNTIPLPGTIAVFAVLSTTLYQSSDLTDYAKLGYRKIYPLQYCGGTGTSYAWTKGPLATLKGEIEG